MIFWGPQSDDSNHIKTNLCSALDALDQRQSLYSACSRSLSVQLNFSRGIEGRTCHKSVWVPWITGGKGKREQKGEVKRGRGSGRVED